MTIEEHIPLAPFTTFGIGGPARYFAEAHTKEEVLQACAYARERHLPVRILGGGSNLLVPDEGIAGMVIRCAAGESSFEEESGAILCKAGAGTPWDELVAQAASRGWWGIENLAGIPGTVAGAAVQNIGAYGAELSSVFVEAEVASLATGDVRTVGKEEAAFGYRTSFFKAHPELCITRVTLRLAPQGTPNLAYADLARANAEGVRLTHPGEIAHAVRDIRARKFPDLREEGTAGSFFKNPVIPALDAEAIAARFGGVPRYPQEGGAVKVSLAWLFDRALSLKGLSHGRARLFENQPLVVVVKRGARAEEVEALARDVEARVRETLGFSIEREVETFTASSRG